MNWRSLVRSLLAVGWLCVAGRVTLSAEPRVRAVSRYQPAGGGPAFWRLQYETTDARPPYEELWSSAEDRPEVYLLPGTVITLPESGNGGVAWPFLARGRGEPPGVLRVYRGEGSNRFTVDWSGAKDDDTLPAAWEEAARAHFEALRTAGALTGFAQHALGRLQPAAANTAEGSFLRSQDLRFANASVFDLTTGAVAIEESLQLERLRGTGRNRKLEADVPIASVAGVTIRSHPWEEMLKGKRPEPHPIERFLPLDQYAFEAASFAGFLELADWLDEWGSPLLHWMEHSAEDAGVKERLERQLCLPSSAVARMLGPIALGRVAATGGDPFLREGADLTLIFELKVPQAFFANLEKNRAEAEAKVPGARRLKESHRRHEIAGLVAPDRAISSWSAEVDGQALVSNSLAGLKRVLDAFDDVIDSQADGLDRRYVRTLLPRGDGEGAFLFLSDPFIRRLVGPGLKLRESRRLECSASLRAIAHAAAWRRVRGEKRAASLGDLLEARDLESASLFCPDGGEHRLLDGGRAGACSVHGTLEFLTPNAELELTHITAEEKQAYDRFRETYQSYWSRFFDPIGIQVGLGKRKRFETVILPLIESTEYREMADLFGGQGAQRGPLPEAGEATSLLFSLHLNRESRLFRQAENMAGGILNPTGQGAQAAALAWVGERVSLFLEDAPEGMKSPPADASLDDLLEEAVKGLYKGAPGGLRIGIRNPLLLAGFLGALKNMVLSAAPGVVEFNTLPERKGASLVQVLAKGEWKQEDGPEALYYGVIGDGLYLGFDRGSLERVIDRHAASKSPSGGGKDAAAASPADAPAAKEKETATAAAATWLDGSHVALGIFLARAPRWREILGGLFEKEAGSLCATGVRRLALLDRLGLADPAGQRALQGASCRCPAGGRLASDGAGGFRCSVHGAAAGGLPRETGRNPLRSLAEARASLSFTTDGVRTLLEIQE